MAGQCFVVTGMVSAHNGIPSVRIRPDGTKRLLGVLPPDNEIMPEFLKNSLDFDHSFHARMMICPFTKKERGVMQFVCVESASHVKPVAW